MLTIKARHSFTPFSTNITSNLWRNAERQRDSANVKILLNTLNSYLSHQPILLLLAYYIINRREKYLHDYWPLNESILKEVIQKLGHAYSF